MIAAFVLATLLSPRTFASDVLSERHVTMTCRAMPLWRFVEKFKDQSGVPLECDPIVGQEIIILKATNRSVADVMEKVGTAMNAQWVRSDNGYRITRTPEFLAKEREKASARRLRFIRASLKVIDDSSDKTAFNQQSANMLLELGRLQAVHDLEEEKKNGGEGRGDMSFGGPSMDMNRRVKIDEKLPAGRLLKKLMLAITPETYASVADGDGVTFATQPRPQELPFNEDAKRLFATYLAERDLWNGTYSKSEVGRYQPENDYGVQDQPAPQPPKQPSRLLLHYSANVAGEWSPGLGSFILYVLDDKGAIVDMAQDYSFAYGYGYGNYKWDEEKGEYKKVKPEPPMDYKAYEAEMDKLPPAKLSPDSKLIADYFRDIQNPYMPDNSGKQKETKSLTDLGPQVQNWLLHPEEFEPLSFGYSDVALQRADLSKMDLALNATNGYDWGESWDGKPEPLAPFDPKFEFPGSITLKDGWDSSPKGDTTNTPHLGRPWGPSFATLPSGITFPSTTFAGS